MITLYTMAYNEDVLLQYMIDHYRTRFANIHIVLYDNESTDNTVKIAKENNCEIINYPTNNEVNDFKLRELKNNCWKTSKTDWVLVCDVDEFLDIDEKSLKLEESNNVTIIKSEGWNMINMNEDYNFDNIKYGTRVTQYDKYFLFNKKYISQINYTCGCHTANPIGKIKLSNESYKLYHLKVLNSEYLINRYKITAKRISEQNKRHGMGNYYFDNEKNIKAGIESGRNQAKNNKVR